MTDFCYQGPVAASKSVLNRALIVQSYFPALKIDGDSSCDDVQKMKWGLQAFNEHQTTDCGAAGTVLRFLALRVSRKKGQWTLTGSERLFERPQNELVSILKQLGVDSQLHNHELTMQSSGWQRPSEVIQIKQSESSQFASALLLNCWDLDFPISFELTGLSVSEDYLKLTINMLSEMGMKIDQQKNKFEIPALQKIRTSQFRVESDMSSSFSIAAAAALAGEVKIQPFFLDQNQPDFIFVEVLKKMGVEIELGADFLKIKKTRPLSSINFDMRSCPDLFPVLSVLCVFARGTSRLYGAPQLVHKESDRLEKTKELLGLLQVNFTAQADGLEIQGQPDLNINRTLQFDPSEDHRMAMAAGLLKRYGIPIEIKNKNVVNKSYPEFWSVLGLE